MRFIKNHEFCVAGNENGNSNIIRVKIAVSTVRFGCGLFLNKLI